MRGLWLAAELGIQVKYDVVHNLVHEKLKADKESPWDQKQRAEPGAVKTSKELAQKLTSVFKEVKKQSKV